jgi:hypothetical protein
MNFTNVLIVEDEAVIKRVNRPGTLGCLIKPLEPSELENILLGSAKSLSM